MAAARPRRVVLVVGNYVNVVDGVARTYRRLIAERRRAGDELLVLAPGSRRPRSSPAGPFVALPSVPIPVPPESRMALAPRAWLRRRLESFEPELIHVSSPDLAGTAAQAFAAAHGVPVVGAYHSEIARYLRYLRPRGLGLRLEPAMWSWVRRFYERCTLVLAPSASMLDELRRRGLSGELRLWERGVDAQRFAPSFRAPSWRARWGVAVDEPLVLFVARLRWEKGLAVLVEALRALEDGGVAHRSAIVGAGPARRALARRLPNTIFTGELRDAALARAYASADLFLYPSATETFGMVTLEAMASGLATVCADAPGSRSLVVPGRTGELVAAVDDGRAFAAVAEALLGDRARLRSFGQAARRRALSWTWERALAQCLAGWDEAMGR